MVIIKYVVINFRHGSSFREIAQPAGMVTAMLIAVPKSVYQIVLR